MTDTKSPFASKTLWGVLLQAVASVLVLLKIDLPWLTDNIQYFAEAAAIIVGAALGVWGRITAKKEIKMPSSGTGPGGTATAMFAGPGGTAMFAGLAIVMAATFMCSCASRPGCGISRFVGPATRGAILEIMREENRIVRESYRGK